jgi:hypothetical protein
MRKKDEIEVSLLKRFGLRYSILAAWEGDLLQKGISVPPSVSRQLARARMKISSGCFTACDVGCDLARAEATIFSTAVTAGLECAESWLNMLGECMSESGEIEELEKKIVFPAVRMQYNRFNFDGACGACSLGDALEA